MAGQTSTARKRKHEELDDGKYDSFELGTVIEFQTWFRRTFTVHESLLKKNAEYYRKKDTATPVILWDTAHCMMENYCRYLYAGRKNILALARGSTSKLTATELVRCWQFGLAIGDIGYMNACMSGLCSLELKWPTFTQDFITDLSDTALYRWYMDGKASALTADNIQKMRGKDVPNHRLIDYLAKVYEARQNNEELTLPTLQEAEKYHVDDTVLKHASRPRLQAQFGLK